MDMWTTQERCPHAHSLNNKYKRLNQPSTKSPTDSPEEALCLSWPNVSKAPPARKPAKQKRNIAVDMWTTQERCPHAHSDNNKRKQSIKID
jgi:metal-sulfur cluster biosynthetic enzyme